MHLMPILKKVVLPSVKECMKNGGKIGMASIESSASIVVHVVIRVKSIPSSVGGLGRLGLIGVTLYHMPHKSGGTHDNGSSSPQSITDLDFQHLKALLKKIGLMIRKSTFELNSVILIIFTASFGSKS